jgi:hypothetical protein
MSVARASGIYIAQNATGANTGADCADAHSAAWFNTNATGGNTYHLCGTFTGTANAAPILSVPNSGTAGSPLIVLAEPGVVFTAPYWAGSFIDSGEFHGAIVVNNKNYVILDGGTNGTIQNTDNGTGKTYQVPSWGMSVKGANLIVRNWTIKDIFVPTNALGGSSTADLILQYGSTNATICNNQLSYAYTGLVTYGVGASTQVTDCQSNTFGTGTNIFLNTFQNQVWNINNSPNAASSPNIYANSIQLAGTFGIRVQGCAGADAHTDGIISYAQGAGVVVEPYIYNNEFVGDTGNGCPTAHVYCTYGFGANSGSACRVFNNIMVSTRTNGGADAVSFGGGSGYIVGPHKIYNNTFVNHQWTAWVSNAYASPGNDKYRNNIFQTVQNNAGSFFYGYNGIAPYNVLDINNNVYYDPTTGGSAGWWVHSVTSNSLAQWQTNCSGNVGLGGCDSASIYGDPQLTASYTLQSGSPARSLGENLTSSCTGQMAPLCYDKPPIVGRGGSLTGSVQRPTSGAWDAGAYQYSTQAGTAAPAGLTAVVN